MSCIAPAWADLQQAHCLQSRSHHCSGLRGVATVQGVPLCAARKACSVPSTAVQLTWCPWCRLCAHAEVRRLVVPLQGAKAGRPGEPWGCAVEGLVLHWWLKQPQQALFCSRRALVGCAGPWQCRAASGSCTGHQGMPWASARSHQESCLLSAAQVAPRCVCWHMLKVPPPCRVACAQS